MLARKYDTGELRSRILIQKKSYVSNDFGGYAVTWVDVDVVWGKGEAMKGGREIEKLKQTYATKKIKITIRYRPDIYPDMRLKFNDKYLNIIESQLADNRKEMLDIVCEEAESGQQL